MPIGKNEFDAMLSDPDKWIDGDIHWKLDPGHANAVEFQVAVGSGAGYPLRVNAWLSPPAGKLYLSVLLLGDGRVYALDLGSGHRNPGNRALMGEDKHKHRWPDLDTVYVPDDITAALPDVRGVWRQFCAEAGIIHRGELDSPPAAQRPLF